MITDRKKTVIAILEILVTYFILMTIMMFSTEIFSIGQTQEAVIVLSVAIYALFAGIPIAALKLS